MYKCTHAQREYKQRETHRESENTHTRHKEKRIHTHTHTHTHTRFSKETLVDLTSSEFEYQRFLKVLKVFVSSPFVDRLVLVGMRLVVFLQRSYYYETTRDPGC